MFGNRVFAGEYPRISPRNLPESGAQAARNCWLDRGFPRPLPAVRQLSIGAIPADAGNIYRYDGQRWFIWPGTLDVDVVQAPVRNDVSNRVCWTGHGYPKQTFVATAPSQVGTISSSWTSPGVPPFRTLGVPAPADNAFSAEVQPFPDGTTEDEDERAESHAYVMTYLTDLDEEGPPSNPVSVDNRGFDEDGNLQPVHITFRTAGVDLADESRNSRPYGINRKRLYRVRVGDSAVTYNLVAEIPLARQTPGGGADEAYYADTKASADLGIQLVSLLWDPPPDDLRGLISLPNGVLAGFKGRDVYFSEPYQPHAWPQDYIKTVDDPIVGLGAYATVVVVGTEHRPFIINGADPASAIAQRLELEQPCSSKHSFASIDLEGVCYASPEGLVLAGPRGAQVISTPVFRERQWNELRPGDFRSTYHDTMYIAWSAGATGQAVVMGKEMQGVSFIDDANVLSVWRDAANDLVYLLIDGGGAGRSIWQWDTKPQPDDVLRTMRWRGRLNIAPARCYSAAQVIAEGYPVTFRVFLDGSSQAAFTHSVTSRSPFRIPATLSNRSEWTYEVEGQHGVREVRVGMMSEMLEY